MSLVHDHIHTPSIDYQIWQRASPHNTEQNMNALKRRISAGLSGTLPSSLSGISIGRRPSITIHPLEYVLDNLDHIKIAYYHTSKWMLNKESVDNIDLFFSDHSPVTLPVKMLECFAISSQENSEPVKCSILETQAPGHYNVVFTPTCRGKTEMQVKIGGKLRHTLRAHISVPPSSRGTPMATFTRLKYPYAVEIMRDGTKIVSEFFSHRITLLDEKGKFKKSFGSPGTKPGELNHPSGLAFTPQGTLLVSDRDNNRIQEFNLQGECLKCVGRRGTGRLQFNYPEGIAISPITSMVYVADCYNHRIQVLNPDLTYADTIGSLGTETGEFKHPFDLAFDSHGFLYVTDRCNNRVQKLTLEEKMCMVLKSNLDGPTGITIDDQDVLFVCEYGLDLIVAISSKGDFIPCELLGRCKGPYGIKFDPYTGDIVVCDTRNNRMLVF